MKYLVNLEVDTTVSVEVEASSPEEAMRIASYKDAPAEEFNVTGYRPLWCVDADGVLHENKEL